MRTRALLLTLVVALSACVRAETEFLSPQRYSPIAVDSVTIFTGAAELEPDSIAYERLAMIFLKGDQSFTDQRDMIRKAREEAAKIGANGIVISTMAEGQYDAFWGVQGDRQGSVVAIRWWIVEREIR
jgi:hypothetical protein